MRCELRHMGHGVTAGAPGEGAGDPVSATMVALARQNIKVCSTAGPPPGHRKAIWSGVLGSSR